MKKKKLELEVELKDSGLYNDMLKDSLLKLSETEKIKQTLVDKKIENYGLLTLARDAVVNIEQGKKDLEKINDGELEVGERIQLQEFTFDEFINLTAKEHFRDWEVSLYIYRAIKDKRKFESIRKIFLP